MRLSAGPNHSCYAGYDGSVRCWGDNAFGQIGDGTRRTQIIPTLVQISSGKNLTMALATAAGWDHSCAIVAGGKILCWGSNSHGQLGIGQLPDQFFATEVPALSPSVNNVNDAVVQVAAGRAHTCALVSTRSVYCWGNNTYGQVSPAGTRTDYFSPVPLPVTGVSFGADTIAAGENHTCAILATIPSQFVSGGVRCWGSNSRGQLGTSLGGAHDAIVVLPSLAVSITAGRAHTCAVRVDGGVSCWGENAFGQLGDDTLTDRATPVDVVGLTDVVALSAGDSHTCAVLADGSGRCWGLNQAGQLGDRTKTTQVHARRVLNFSNGLSVAAGLSHSCAALASGSLACWGGNALGQLGNKTNVDSLQATGVALISGGVSAKAVSVGEYDACAIRSNGTLSCWGLGGVSRTSPDFRTWCPSRQGGPKTTAQSSWTARSTVSA